MAPWFLRCFGQQPAAKMAVSECCCPRILFRLLGDEGAHAASCEMDGELWRQLPGEVLVDCVLPRLPRVSQHRFRAVCKEWMHLLRSPHFPHADSGPLLCAFRKLGPIAAGRGLPPRRKLHPVALPSCHADKVVAQDGFLSVEDRVLAGLVLLVNPLTNSWFRVDRPFGDPWRAKMNAEMRKDGTVKVYACGTMHMYQGSISPGNTQRWTSAAPFGRFLARASSVVSKRTLYHYDATHESLFVCNIEAGGGQWHDAVAHRMGAGSIKYRLVERGGRVYMVGAMYQGVDVRYHVCKLDESLMLWEPLTVMPTDMVKHFIVLLDGVPTTFDVCAAAHCLLLIFRNKSMVHIVSFDLVTFLWQPCFQNEDPRKLAMFDGFFEPRLDLHFHKANNRLLRTTELGVPPSLEDEACCLHTQSTSILSSSS